MYARILVPLDGSKAAEAALPLALALAVRWGAEIEVVAVPVEKESRASVESYLAALRERMAVGGLVNQLRTHLLSAGEPTARILERLAASHRDLVVMTTRGRGAVRRAWLGSTADGVVRASPVPVLLIPPDRGPNPDGGAAADLEKDGATGTDAVAPPAPFRRVVLPMDGSDEAERMLEHTAPLLEASDPEWILLRVIPPFVPGGSPYLPHMVRDLPEQTQVHAAAQEYLDRMAESVPTGRARTRVVTVGQPALGILQVAEEEGADLIAMPTAGRGGVSRLLLGSVADKVIRNSEVPVLVSRHSGEG
ncbi:MAG: universal stress protein [Gemmatimonadota bacterium]